MPTIRKSLATGALAVAVAAFSAATAQAQLNYEPNVNGCQTTLESNPRPTAFELFDAWALGGFGSFRFHGWGRTTVARPGSHRAPVAVLRERRGLQR